MTAQQKTSIQSIHFFTQQYFLEGNIGVYFSHSGFSTKKLKITLRHQDWWFWERNQPIAINPFRAGRALPSQMEPPQRHDAAAWGNHLKNIQGLEQFEMEFETLTDKRNQLDAIVALARNWVFEAAGGRKLRNVSVSQSSWEGEVSLRQDVGNEDESVNGAGPRIQSYYVVSMVWKPTTNAIEA